MTTIGEPTTLEAAGPRYRFTLRSLFAGMTLLGVFLGVWNLENASWIDALRSVASLLLVVGLVQQVFDFLAALKIHREYFRAGDSSNPDDSRPENSPDVFSLPTDRAIWEITWRFLLGALVLVFIVETILQRMFPKQFEGQFSMPYGGEPNIGWQLVLLMLLLSSQRYKRRGHPVTEKYYSAVLLLAVIGLAFFVINNWAGVDYLVYTAIRGVENAQPAFRQGKPFYHSEPHDELRQTIILGGWYALWGLIVTLLSGWFALNSKWLTIRVSLGVIAVGGLVTLVAANLWAQKLLWELDSFRHVNPDLLRPYFVLNLVTIAAIYAAGATWVLLRDVSVKNPATLELAWRRDFGSYLPERRPCLWLIGIAAAEPAASILVGYVRLLWGPWRWLAGSLADLVCQPTVLLSMLATFVVVQSLLRSRTSAAIRKQEPLAWQPVPWLSASLLWLAIMVLLFVITATFYWLAWARWLSG